jgi:hypothetical protein
VLEFLSSTVACSSISNIQLDVLVSPVSSLRTPGGDSAIERIAVRTAGAAGSVSLALAALGGPASAVRRCSALLGMTTPAAGSLQSLSVLGWRRTSRLCRGRRPGSSSYWRLARSTSKRARSTERVNALRLVAWACFRIA